MYGMKSTTVLKVQGEGIVRLAEDTITGSYSIGLRTATDIHWKEISKELHDLLVKEVGENNEV